MTEGLMFRDPGIHIRDFDPEPIIKTFEEYEVGDTFIVNCTGAHFCKISETLGMVINGKTDLARGLCYKTREFSKFLHQTFGKEIRVPLDMITKAIAGAINSGGVR